MNSTDVTLSLFSQNNENTNLYGSFIGKELSPIKGVGGNSFLTFSYIYFPVVSFTILLPVK